MLSFINMECPACGSEYTLSIEELNVVVLFKCFECDQHNMYVAGHVLELDQEIMDEGTQKEKERHITETVQFFACEFAGNVLKNVDRVINVNMEIDIPQVGGGDKRRKVREATRAKEISGPRLSPSVVREDAPAISHKEVREFVQIDLNLIDKKKFFDRFFSEPRGKAT